MMGALHSAWLLWHDPVIVVVCCMERPKCEFVLADNTDGMFDGYMDASPDLCGGRLKLLVFMLIACLAEVRAQSRDDE